MLSRMAVSCSLLSTYTLNPNPYPSQALFAPMAASCSLLLIFYFFSTVAQIMTAFAAYASGTSLVFALDPVAQCAARPPGVP